MTKIEQDNDMINRLYIVYAKIELKCHDRSNRMDSITKSRQENDVIDRIGVIPT